MNAMAVSICALSAGDVLVVGVGVGDADLRLVAAWKPLNSDSTSKLCRGLGASTARDIGALATVNTKDTTVAVSTVAAKNGPRSAGYLIIGNLKSVP